MYVTIVYNANRYWICNTPPDMCYRGSGCPFFVDVGRNFILLIMFYVPEETNRIWVRYVTDSERDVENDSYPILSDTKPRRDELLYNKEYRLQDGRWILVEEEDE
jgi:hypothetical protein